MSHLNFLIERYEKRKNAFENWKKLCKEIKEYLSNLLKEYKVICFGSVVEGNYAIGLSDIDLLIISDEFKDRNLRYRVLSELIFKFGDPFEFHLVTKEEAKWYFNFIKKYVEI